jgi:hypothetical protein
MTRLVTFVVMFLATAAPAPAQQTSGGSGQAAASNPQSLADIARAEEARRQTVQKPAKVYTNTDLRADFTAPTAPAAGPTPAADAPAAAGPGGGASGNATPSTPAEPAAPQKDQAWWSSRMSAARTDLERTRMFAEALQTRINALTTDFVNRDDPAQRAVIEQERNKALAELARVQKDVEAKTKAIADIEDEARRAGVPPGWLR